MEVVCYPHLRITHHYLTPFPYPFVTLPNPIHPFFATRFGFHNASTIDSLLDKEDVLLEAILDEDDLIQECKAQNTRLIDYFGRVDVLHKLLGYVTEQIESEEKGKFKSVAFKSILCANVTFRYY